MTEIFSSINILVADETVHGAAETVIDELLVSLEGTVFEDRVSFSLSRLNISGNNGPMASFNAPHKFAHFE